MKKINPQRTTVSASRGGMPLMAWVGILALLLLAIVQFGLSYAVSNQNTYLIDGLMRANPNWFAVDWFARSTIHYHNSFSALIEAISRAGMSVAFVTSAIEFLIRVIAMGAVFWVAFKIDANSWWVGLFAIAMLSLSLLESTSASVGVTYLFDGYLQPSSFGAGFLLLGIALLAHRRYLLSGLALAFAGFMHANYLILVLMFLPFTHLLLGRDGLIKRAVINITPVALVLLNKLSLVLAVASSDPALQVRAAEIVFQIRAPHHYYPITYLVDFLQFFGWVVLGLAAYCFVKRPNDVERTLFSIILPIAGIVLAATVLTTVVFVPTVAKLFVWRLAPFAVVLSQLLFFTVCVRHIGSQHSLTSAKGRLGMLGMVIGVLMIVLWNLAKGRWNLLTGTGLVVVAVPLGLFVVRRYLASRDKLDRFEGIGAKLVALGYVGVLVVVLGLLYPSIIDRSNVVGDYSAEPESQLYQWAATTPVDSLFAIPVEFEDFRLQSRRSVVVDWKSIPHDPAGALEWYRRVEAVTGAEGFDHRSQTKTAYRQMDSARADKLVATYGVDYVVVLNDMHGDLSALSAVYQNARYSVYSTVRSAP